MKLILNKCYGGASLSEWAVDALDRKYSTDLGRTEDEDPKLIHLIEAVGSEKVSGWSANLKVVEIPDNCTDYEITEYDGYENVLYVVDGKIYHA